MNLFGPCYASFSSSLLLLSLELSDTHVDGPYIRALLGTASQFCEVVDLKLHQPLPSDLDHNETVMTVIRSKKSFVYYHTWWYMTLGRCPLSIVCSLGTPPSVYHPFQGQSKKSFGDVACSLGSGNSSAFLRRSPCRCAASKAAVERTWHIQRYLAHSKHPPPKTLQ